jgi:hypothetical protein
MKTNVHLWQYLDEFFLKWEVLQTKFVVQKTKTHVLCSETFFRNSRRLLYNVDKCGAARQDHRWQYYTADAPCMPDN